jgi:hypothetical protein
MASVVSLTVNHQGSCSLDCSLTRRLCIGWVGEAVARSERSEHQAETMRPRAAPQASTGGCAERTVALWSVREVLVNSELERAGGEKRGGRSSSSGPLSLLVVGLVRGGCE